MHAETLLTLGVAALAAGLLARLGRRIGLPTVPFFMGTGILLGPHMPWPPVVHETETWQLLSAVGIVLLLFHLGVEFPLQQVLSSGRRLLLAGATYIAANVSGGLLYGFLLGWGAAEAMVVAGIMGISSSAIVTKLLVELRRLANAETPVLLGVIVVEDIFLAVYLAVLQPVVGGAGGPLEIFVQIATSFGFLLVLLVLARFGARLVGALLNTEDDELLTVAFFGLAVLVAGASEMVGVSDAIGALMIGLVVSQTVVRERVEQQALPLRDLFAALFFLVFGASVQLGGLGTVALPVLGAVLLTVALNLLAGLLVARMYRLNQRAAANLGLTLLGRGEFALILATMAATAGLDERIGSFTALYVLVLAVLSPLLASASRRLARFIPDRVMSGSWAYVQHETMSSGCPHLGEVAQVEPAGRYEDGCPECLAVGDTWVHLRSCLVCGQVGCCNDSKNKHGTAHFEETGHPMLRTIEPTEDWWYCYLDEVLLQRRSDEQPSR
ncbi:cation:proton antiporter [Georgenia alba]|uniref:Cation:proton antiporter n=1 Tax=Georgenia alba TaxID=2233858 RepID=A0ABW2Q8U2_9MICO